MGRQLETGPGLKRGVRLSIRNLLAPNTAGLLSADSFYELLCSVQGKLSLRRPLHLDQMKKLSNFLRVINAFENVPIVAVSVKCYNRSSSVWLEPQSDLVKGLGVVAPLFITRPRIQRRLNDQAPSGRANFLSLVWQSETR